jgi:hypothetical protein
MEYLVVIGVVWLIFAGLGSWIASQKRRDGGEGFLLGLLFGPFGCLIEAVLPNGAPPPPPVVKTPEQIAADEARWKAFQAAQARREKELEEEARLAGERFDAALHAVWRFVTWPFRISMHFLTWFLSFEWYQDLPEWAQPVVIGLGIAIPAIAIVIVIFRW